MLIFKRILLVLVISFVGYFIILHYGFTTDRMESIAWYYKVELFIGGMLWWPAYLYLEFRELIGYPTKILGFELWLFQFVGYFILFKVYDFKVKHNK